MGKFLHTPSLRFILWSGFLSFAGLLVVALIWSAFSEARARRTSGERSIQSIARAIEENIARSFDASEQTLLDLTETIAERGGIARIGERELHEMFRRRIQRAPNARGIFAYDAAGSIYASSYRFPVTKVAAIPPYVAVQLNGQESGTVIDLPRAGAFSGLPIIALTRALRQSDGTLSGVIGLSLKPEYFNGFYKSMDLGTRVVVITDEGGALMVRYPPAPSASSAQLPMPPATRSAGDMGAGAAFVAESSLDGAPVLCAFRGVEGRPVRIAICTPAEPFSVLWWPGIRYNMEITALALAIAAILFFLILRQLSELERSEAEKRITKFTLDHVGDMVAWIDMQGHFSFANPMALRVLGYSAEQWRALAVTDVFPDFDLVRLARAWQYLKKRGHASVETVARTADGRLIQIEANSNFIEYGGVEYNCAVMRDIGARKASEAALRESEIRLRTIFDTSPVAIIISTLEEGCILYVNRATTVLNGYTAAEMIGRTGQDIRFWESEQERKSLFEGHLERGGRYQFDKSFYRKDGSPAHGLVSAALIELEGQQRVITIIQDMTPLRAQEAALRESEARFARFFDVSPIAMVISGLDDGRATDINPAFSQAFGYLGDEAIGKTSVEMGMVVDRPGREQRLERLRSGGRNGPDEIAVRSKSGEIQYMLTSAFVIELSGKQRVVTFFQDISERIRTEEGMRRFNEMLERRVAERTGELARANRELESFSYSVSHDLRSPLRGIDGFSALLAERYGAVLGEQGMGYLERVRRAATRMGKLIDDLLNLARIGRHEIKREPVDVSAMAVSIVDELRLFDAVHPREIVIAPGLRAVADASLLRIVLDNLLRNAWKFTANTARPRIEVGATGDAEPVYFVRDNGVGFDMRFSAQLFGPFQRLHDAREFEGTGIGLAIVRRVVQRHGGEIWAEGVVDQGATFHFSLPQASA